MPSLLPFRGLRPNPAVALLSDVVCPPYDVINERERARLVARSPYNVVRVELPAGDYAGAAALLATWERDGVLQREDKPALYGYRMSYRDATGNARETLGVIGALVLEPPGQGILPHEQTTPKDKTDRLELIRATRANTSPIWCLCTQPGLARLLGSACPPSPGTGAAASAVDEDGVTHEIWPVYDPGTQRSIASLTSAAPLLVADGHHRYETALTYLAEMAPARSASQAGQASPGNIPLSGERADATAGPSDALGPEAVLSLVVELSEGSLQVMAIHRAVSGLPAGTDVLSVFRSDFTLKASSGNSMGLAEEMTAAGAVAVVTPEAALLATPRPGSPSATFELDSSRVDNVLAKLPPHQLSYHHDLGGAIASVREGRLDAAVLCRPATVAQIAATARGGALMPPKTTFFWPKPRTGMVFRHL